MTSLADIKRYIQRKKKDGPSNFAAGYYKTTCGSRAARALRGYKLSSLGASRLTSLGKTVTVGHFQDENVRWMVYASYQLILDFETKAEYQVEYDVLKAKQRTQAKTISLSSLGSGSKLEQSHQQWAA